MLRRILGPAIVGALRGEHVGVRRRPDATAQATANAPPLSGPRRRLRSTSASRSSRRRPFRRGPAAAPSRSTRSSSASAR